MITITGTVLSNKIDKTVVISVDSYKSHAKYHKKYKVTKKFYAHDENNACKMGDVVTINESRPLSRLKRWTVATA
jgi:small subunit ribosomal protein S17